MYTSMRRGTRQRISNKPPWPLPSVSADAGRASEAFENPSAAMSLQTVLSDALGLWLAVALQTGAACVGKYGSDTTHTQRAFVAFLEFAMPNLPKDPDRLGVYPHLAMVEDVCHMRRVASLGHCDAVGYMITPRLMLCACACACACVLCVTCPAGDVLDRAMRVICWDTGAVHDRQHVCLPTGPSMGPRPRRRFL